MKKSVAFILAFLYLGLTSGLAVNIHYCMGKVADVRFDDFKEDPCKCGGKEKMPCCNHQFSLVKVNDAHQQVAADFSFKAPEATPNSFANFISLLLLSQAQQKILHVNSPPLFSNQHIYLQNCVFRI